MARVHEWGLGHWQYKFPCLSESESESPTFIPTVLAMMTCIFEVEAKDDHFRACWFDGGLLGSKWVQH